MKSVAAMKVSSTHGSWRWPVAVAELLVEHEGVLAAQVARLLDADQAQVRGERRADVRQLLERCGTRRRCAPSAP